jgi:hypothetical protein
MTRSTVSMPRASRNWATAWAWSSDLSGCLDRSSRQVWRNAVGAGLGGAGSVLGVEADGDEVDVVVGSVGQQLRQHLVTQLVEVMSGEFGQCALQAVVEQLVAAFNQAVGVEETAFRWRTISFSRRTVWGWTPSSMS